MNITTHCGRLKLSRYMYSTCTAGNGSIVSAQWNYGFITMNDYFNTTNVCFNTMNDRFKTTTGTIVYHNKWNGTIVLTTTERNNRSDTTEWNDCFNTTEWNGSQNGNWTEIKRHLNGNGMETAVPLHRIQMGTVYWHLSPVCTGASKLDWWGLNLDQSCPHFTDTAQKWTITRPPSFWVFSSLPTLFLSFLQVQP